MFTFCGPPRHWRWARQSRSVGLTILLLLFLISLILPQAGAAAQSEVFRVPPGSGKIALTFDGGENPGRVNDILAALRAHHVTATFFLCGIYIDSFPSRVRAIAQAGHEIASHSYHNVNHTGLGNAQIASELRTTEAALLRVTGKRPVAYWRAPYGYRDDRVVAQVGQLGYRSIMWSLDVRDTVAPLKSADYIYRQITSRSYRELDGAIVLLHVNPNGTVDALPRILTYLDRLGLRAVTVSELLGNSR